MQPDLAVCQPPDIHSRAISLYLPCRSGIWPQRRVRYRLHPPPFSLRLRRLCGRNASPGPKPRGSAGFWARAGAKPNRRRWVPAVAGAAFGNRLCRQVRRFGFASDSLQRGSGAQRILPAIPNSTCKVRRLGFALDSPRRRRNRRDFESRPRRPRRQHRGTGLSESTSLPETRRNRRHP